MSTGRGRTPRGPRDWAGGFPPPARPRDVKGGLTARSARGDIGEHWWSRRFIDVLESFALGSRLTRGKAYARRGQVINMRIDAGSVTAQVQGSRRTPYQARIQLAPFSELVWTKVEVVLAEQAIHSAHLLAGQFPPELEDVLAEAGAPLFPGSASDLSMSCSCPDWEVPCKHLAATFYLLAESFDEDPFRILQWRGRERTSLLARIRELRGDGPTVAPDEVADPAVGSATDTRTIGAAMALAALPGLDPEIGSTEPAHVTGHAGTVDAAAFWSAGVIPPPPVHDRLPEDFLLRQLPTPGPSLGGSDLLDSLRSMYAKLPDSDG
ncbi:MAG: SWIM zinc finger family protein [Candidatus Nanopelagicales bacterium]|nr:SWIM zinc finger family protein [Candidatus Nanopelagicales bacterium]